MGLFSSSYKYFAHAGSSPLFEENRQPETLKSNVVQAVVTEGGPSISNAIRFALGTDYYARAKSVMRYARKEYSYGFPESDFDAISTDNSDVETAISAEIGEAVTVSTVSAGTINEAFLVDRFIQDEYLNASYFAWPSGNPLEPDFDESLAEVEIPVVDPSAVSPASPYYIAPNSPGFNRRTDLGTGRYEIYYNYHDENNISQTWYMTGTADFSTFASGEWVFARYRKDASPGTTHYWVYQIGSNADPAFESSMVRSSINMEFLPVIVLMHDKVWYDEENDPVLEETTHKILRRLNLDPEEIKEDYLEQVAEDIASGDRPKKKKLDEWDFFIHFSVPIHTHTRGSQEYLINFFQQLQADQVSTRTTYLANINSSTIPYSSLKVTEGGENGYNVEYRWAYIHTVTHPGEFLVNGEPLRRNRTYSVVYERGQANDATYKEGIEQVHGVGSTYAAYPGEEDADLHHYAVFTQQHDEDGVKSYTQVLIMAPSMQYQVNTREDPNKVGSYRYRYDTIELFPEDPEQDSEFRWPVHIGSLKEVAVVRREEVLAEALCATVYLVEKQEVKWYQKGFFKWLIIIIAVILIVLSIIFPGFIAAAAVMLSGAATAAGLAFYIVYTILMFAVGFMISMAGNLIGGTLGIIFAVVGAIVSMQAGLAGAPGGAGWGISTAGTNAWGSAFSLIQSTAPYIQGAQKIYTAYEIENLQEEIEDWTREANAAQRELEDAMDLLGDKGGFDSSYLLEDFSGPGFVYESSNSYYSRTLNANPGIIGYDLVNQFADIALTLPEDGFDKNIVDGMMMDFEKQRGSV